ncbi:hypothetical protein IM660_18155 [Ruania alkalisoli]|uniref:Uncharacterized protein n=1 Tax=Ruania alkalisoli TaxID=2779775 RepID=A0A7M1SSD6_9MICO|nr:hypothetical protein [Ruania alkalisoli]QOR70488.1 hypothetical protein IM660_18155 [Ruania alkalisoli]
MVATLALISALMLPASSAGAVSSTEAGLPEDESAVWVEPVLNDVLDDVRLRADEVGEECAEQDDGQTEVCVSIENARDVQLAPVPDEAGGLAARG